jgi:hypothetical protein
VTAVEHLAAAGVALTLARWHVLHAKHGNHDLTRTRAAASVATRQLTAALTQGGTT